jgi:HAD domain in Swiss Army Knife RNA repair proteins
MQAKEPSEDALAAPAAFADLEDRPERIRLRADGPDPGAEKLLRRAEKPLLMVDIDGVISLFGFAGRGAWTERAATPAGSFHTIDGIPHFLSPVAAAHLRSLAEDFELVWASGWEEKAEEYLPHLLDLPAGLPFLRFERSPGRGNAHWKLAAIERHAGARALAWIDDAFNDACHAWARARPEPTLLVQTAPERGLTAVEAQRLTDWARAPAPSSPPAIARGIDGSAGESPR